MTNHYPFLDGSLNVRWEHLTADRVVPDMEEALARGEAKLASLLALDDASVTFDNTFLALQEANRLVSDPWHKVTHLTSVNDHPELRAAHKQVLPKISDFFASIPLNPELYAMLRCFADSEAAGRLGPLEKRLMAETLRDFEDAGASQPDHIRSRLKEIAARLAEITKAFSENSLDSLNAYARLVTDPAELAGLPKSVIEAARQSAMSKGHGTDDAPVYRFTLQAPSFVPVMRFADSENLRKDLTIAYTTVGHVDPFENEPYLREIMALRAEQARLLGRANFPDWVISRRMAKSATNAVAFVDDLHRKTLPAFRAENEELILFRAQSTGTEPGPLAPWDFAYWAEKLRKARYDFDEEQLREYFPVQAVMSGMFAIVERVFGISVEEITQPAPSVWHPEVKLYAVRDQASGRHIGNFYADWFPRESKRSGAWMGPLAYGELAPDGALKPHLGYVIGNMTPPVGDRPALLSHNDVLTIFHEFGHLLHHVLSEVKYSSLGGTNVSWDFVELPSQILENWCWDRDGLDFFARHYETGKPIPDELYQKMIAARNFGAARAQMRQLSFGKMDLSLHLDFDPASDLDLDAFIEAVLADYLPPRTVALPSSIRSFGHLFSNPVGYAAGYYSYKWAEVLDADAFTRFSDSGILNPDTGLAFRRAVLSRGNSDEPETLFREFMGRDPDPDALLRRSGLA